MAFLTVRISKIVSILTKKTFKNGEVVKRDPIKLWTRKTTF